jgi:hypothetical protein
MSCLAWQVQGPYCLGLMNLTYTLTGPGMVVPSRPLGTQHKHWAQGERTCVHILVLTLDAHCGTRNVVLLLVSTTIGHLCMQGVRFEQLLQLCYFAHISRHKPESTRECGVSHGSTLYPCSSTLYQRLSRMIPEARQNAGTKKIEWCLCAAFCKQL